MYIIFYILYIYIYVYIYININIYIYVYVYVCAMYVSIHIFPATIRYSGEIIPPYKD